MKPKNYQNTMRYLRQRYGMCARCGQERGDGSTKWLCQSCREWKRQDNQTRRAQRIAQGLCRTCNQPRGDDGTSLYCRPCAYKSNESIKQMRAQRVAAGLCRQCRRPLKNRTSVCMICLAHWAEQERERRALLRQEGKQ